MPTGAEWDNLTARVGLLYASAETEIISYIVDRLYAGLGSPSWAVTRLAELDAVRRHIGGILSTTQDETTRLVAELLSDAHAQGQAAAITDLEAAGLPSTLPAATGRAVATIAMDTMSYLYKMTPVALRASIDAYQHVISQAAASTALGAQARADATQSALLQFARHGISGFTDKAGRSWRLDSYAEMATRTGAMHALTIGHTDTLRSMGQRFVTVPAHGYTCPKCAPWQGKVLSIDGTQPGVHRVMSAISDEWVTVNVAATTVQAEESGLRHPNCSHTYGLYLPGTAIPSSMARATAEKGYDATQRQRAIERKIRQFKREAAAARDPAAVAASRRKVRAWQNARRELLSEYQDLRRKTRREQVRIAH